MRSIIALLVLLAASFCTAQTAVDLTPIPGPFLYTNGPNTGGALAFGCVFTYQANTNIPLATFTDYTGTTQQPNPVVLNAGGYGSIWFQSGLLYSVKVVSSGGTNCASGLIQYTINGVNANLLNLSNEWQQPQSFDDPINLLAPDLQIVFGSPAGTRTTLDIPPTSADLVLHGPPLTADDTLLSQNATQSVENKNFTSGNQINGCGLTNGPGTYLCVANNTINATVLNSLAVLTGAPSTATLALTTNTAGIVGITVANAGVSGNAVIQQSGLTNCTFDGSTTAGDLVIPSPTINGQCHDSGVGPTGKLSSQVLGQVLASSAGGLTSMDLYGPGISNSPGGTPVATYGGGGGGAGSGAIISLNAGSRDKMGAVTVVTGSAPSGAGNVFILTFSSPFASFASCTFSAANGNASTITAVDGIAATSQFIMNYTSSGMTGSTTYVWAYLCNGY